MEKEKIDNLVTFLKAFDRLFLDASILTSSNGRTFLEYLASNKDSLHLKSRSFIIISSEYDKLLSNSKALTTLGTLNSAGLLRTFQSKDPNQSVGHPVLSFAFSQTYLRFFLNKELRRYNCLLITGDDALGSSLAKLVFDDTHVSRVSAMTASGLSDYEEYVYLPSDEEMVFSVNASSINPDEVYINFVDSDDVNGDRYLYKGYSKETEMKKEADGSFSFRHSRNDLFTQDFDEIVFGFKKDGSLVPLSQYYELKNIIHQNWEFYEKNGLHLARPGSTNNPNPTPTTPTEEVPEVTEGEKWIYHGGESYHPFSKEITNNGPIPKENSSVYLSKNQSGRLTIGKCLSNKGGEGTVYLSERPSEVLKIYKPGKLSTEAKSKIESMTAKPIKSQNMAWPLDSLFNSSGEFVGFSMPKVSGPDANVLIGNKDKVLAGYPSLKKTDLIEFCLNFFMTLDYLHQRNVVIGDIKTDNVVLLGGDITKPILVDCDSFQVGEYICPVVSRFYTPPEYFKKSPDSFFRTFDGDIFSAATLAFMVFTYGRRPFDYRIDPSDPNDYSYEQKEVKGMLPYSLDSANETGLHAPNGEAPAIWSHFPSYIKQLFLDSFAACSFGSGKTRPTSSQWVAGLKSYLLAAKSGSLATIDPEFDEPYQQNVIDYSILNIPLVSNKKAQGVGFSMKDAVIRALMNLKEKTATQVLASKAIAALYHDSSFSEGSFAFVLSTNIGVFKRVSVEFKPSFN